MPVEGVVIVAAAIVLTLVVVLLVARSSGHSKQQEVLRELGFGSVEQLPGEFLTAMQRLHAPEAKLEELGFRQPMKKPLRWGDLYYVLMSIPEEKGRSTMGTSQGLSGFEPRWRLPAVKILVTKEPQGMMETMIVKALRAVVSKHKGRVTLSGTGEFEKRAMAFGQSELEVRRVLTHRLQQALLATPYTMLEMEGPVFTIHRPAQAGNTKVTKEDWRALMDLARTVGEELAGTGG